MDPLHDPLHDPLQDSLQQRFAPHFRCFGCGPANELGLGLASFPEGEFVVARWQAADHHQAFPGVLNGGIVGALMDCHSNWTAAWHLMGRRGVDHPPCTVTADYHVTLRRPTPTEAEIQLRAEVTEASDDRVHVACSLLAGGRVTATCRGLFVAVRPGHPAYHGW